MAELREIVAALHPNNYTAQRDAADLIVGGSITVGLKKKDLQVLLSECLHEARVVKVGVTLADAWAAVLPKAKAAVDALAERMHPFSSRNKSQDIGLGDRLKTKSR